MNHSLQVLEEKGEVNAKLDGQAAGRAKEPESKRVGKGDDKKTAEEWFAGVGAGMKGVSRQLLDQVPPEFRKKVVEQASSHGPGSAAVIVEAAALKARGFKAKIALKTLAKLLRVLDAKIPKE